MNRKVIIRKNKLIEISSKRIFKIWMRFRAKFNIEVICPYCHSITYVWSKTDDNRLHLRCYCEIPRVPTPKTIEIKLTPKFLPHGWIKRKGHPYEWVLKADKDSSQPLGVYLSEFDHKVDYRQKDGYQATLGEFASRFCYVAPLRNVFTTAIKDCIEFMKNHSKVDKIRIILSKYSFSPKYP